LASRRRAGHAPPNTKCDPFADRDRDRERGSQLHIHRPGQAATNHSHEQVRQTANPPIHMFPCPLAINVCVDGWTISLFLSPPAGRCPAPPPSVYQSVSYQCESVQASTYIAARRISPGFSSRSTASYPRACLCSRGCRPECRTCSGGCRACRTATQCCRCRRGTCREST